MKNLVVLVIAGLLSLGMSGEGFAKETSSTKVQQQLEVVNINQATAAEIAKSLKGVGLKKAEAIVELRSKLGGFKRVEQLLDVKGIGEATLEKNRKSIQL